MVLVVAPTLNRSCSPIRPAKLSLLDSRQHPPEDRCASYNDGLVLSEYTPMAPTLVREPFHRDGWIYEEKVDGWRLLAYKDRERVRLVSRNGRDHTRRVAGVAAAVAKLSARSLVLDGEVAIYDEKLRSRFDWLREPDATPFLAICVYSRSLARLHAISMPHC